MPSARPSRIANYDLLSKLGQGAMGVVYRAKSADTGRIVALKVLFPRLSKNATFVERLRRESRAASNLKHENIVQGIDFGESGGLYYFVMEFVEGKTLHQILKEEGPFEERRALGIARQVASALDQAMRFEIIHRDIKPSNILVTANGTAKLADLGLAKELRQEDVKPSEVPAPTLGEGSDGALGGTTLFYKWVGGDSTLTQQGTTLGTPYYMSPEQARGGSVDSRADIYSLGATLYHVLAGAPPYTGATLAEIVQRCLEDSLPDIRTRRPGISEETARLLSAMMEKDRRNRIGSPAAVVEWIDAILDGKSLPREAFARAEPSPADEALATDPEDAPLEAEPLTAERKSPVSAALRPGALRRRKATAPTPAPKKSRAALLAAAALLLLVGGILLANPFGAPPERKDPTAAGGPAGLAGRTNPGTGTNGAAPGTPARVNDPATAKTPPAGPEKTAPVEPAVATKTEGGTKSAGPEGAADLVATPEPEEPPIDEETDPPAPEPETPKVVKAKDPAKPAAKAAAGPGGAKTAEPVVAVLPKASPPVSTPAVAKAAGAATYAQYIQ
ncbi:MAG: protein kinase, partial [Planctomycetota bacterium]